MLKTIAIWLFIMPIALAVHGYQSAVWWLRYWTRSLPYQQRSDD